MLSTFHFLRPWWLVALIPALILYFYYLRNFKLANDNWEQHCDAHLLPHLISSYEEAQKSSWLPYLILAAWILAILALAGPTWSLYAQAVYQKNIARVIVLDVSPTMNSSDIAPTRLERAKYKTLDLLKEIREGQTGMLVFSSSPFVVSPLTNDTKTIANMVPILDSTIVPVQGSDIGKALKKAGQLLSQAGFTQGEIILITATNPTNKDSAVANNLARQGFYTSVLAIGTRTGGPVNDASGSFATDKDGAVVFAGLDNQKLQDLANKGKGTLVAFTGDNTDITKLLNNSHLGSINTNKATSTLETKALWQDEGHLLIWVLIIVAALFARKGWLNKLC